MNKSFVENYYVGNFLLSLDTFGSLSEKVIDERTIRNVSQVIKSNSTPSFRRTMSYSFEDDPITWYGNRYILIPQIKNFETIIKEINKKLKNKIEILNVYGYNNEISVVLYKIIPHEYHLNQILIRVLKLLIPNIMGENFSTYDEMLEIYNKKLRSGGRDCLLIYKLDYDLFGILSNEKLITFLMNTGVRRINSIKSMMYRIRNYKKYTTGFVITDGKVYFSYGYPSFNHFKFKPATSSDYRYATNFASEEKAKNTLYNFKNNRDDLKDFEIKNIEEVLTNAF